MPPLDQNVPGIPPYMKERQPRWEMGACAAALAVGLVVALLFKNYANFEEFFTRLDPGNARRVCLTSLGVEPLCDFATVYYRQGLALPNGAMPVRGFYYSPLFALLMAWLALLPYSIARIVWGLIVLSALTGMMAAPLVWNRRRSPLACFVYAALFAATLPVLHEVSYGQVSSLLSVLVLASFLCYDRNRRVLSVALLALAAAIKFYPAIFAVHYLGRGDTRSFVAFALTAAILIVAVPVAVMGGKDYLFFVTELRDALALLSLGTAESTTSNFAANAISVAFTGRSRPADLVYVLALCFSLLVSGAHLLLMTRAAKQQRSLAAMMIGFATIPFAVRSSWVHYFVFLPCLQVYVMDGASMAGATRVTRWLCRLGPALSAALCSFVLFLFFEPTAYYRAAPPFWSTVALLPGLYARELMEFRRINSAH